MLAAILLAAILLRVIAVDAYGLWTDEALTIVLSNWSVTDMLLLPTDPTPLLYYVLHKLFIPANAPLEVVRSISVVAGVMSVGLMYLLGRQAFGKSGGVIAAALLAAWSAHVDYSQEARAYSLLFLLTLLTSVGLVYYAHLLRQETAESRMADPGRRVFALALFGIGNVLAFYAHVIATFWSVLTGLMLIAIVRRNRRGHGPELIAVFAAMAVCALPGIYRLIQQMLAGDDFHWLQQADLLEFAATSATVFLPVGLWDNPLMNALGTGGAVQAVVAIAAIVLVGAGFWFGGRRLRRSLRERPVVLWLILAYLTAPILIWLFGFVARPLFMDRTILFAVPGAILLITALCLALEKRAATWAAFAAVLLYGASTLSFGIMREKEDWRGAYEYLAAVTSPGDAIAICPLYNYPALRYHALAQVASSVLAMAADRKLVQIERGLGANPDWDKTYFRHFLVPRVSGRRVMTEDTRVPDRLDLDPGQSVWRVDGHCNPGYSADLDAALSAVSPDPDIAWRQMRKDPRAFGITIRRYRVVGPVAFDIETLVSPRQEADAPRSLGRVP